ncbi:MAG TPA: rhodanese-like domain-containing protein [Phaeodactylibacter sp.]|nr:rhodanese-like domain-containing protein [Phaeodactylibacter sp.]
MFGFIKKMFGIEEVDIESVLRQGAVIIDVRTPQEFKSGHPKGAVNIPLQKIKNSTLKIKKYKKPVITCCASGRRSGTAASILKNAGIEVYNGGGWKKVSTAVRNKSKKKVVA